MIDRTHDEGADDAPESGREAATFEAELIADTRDSERRLGLRGQICERRLLFRGPGAYVEMCVPPNAAEGGSWLHGQIVLATPPPSEDVVTATLTLPTNDAEPVTMSERGDFALPLPGLQPDQEVCVEIQAPQGRMYARFVA